MKESLRRLCVFALYVGSITWIVLELRLENLINSLIEFEPMAYGFVVGVIVAIAVVHRSINWIFQRNESKDTD